MPVKPGSPDKRFCKDCGGRVGGDYIFCGACARKRGFLTDKNRSLTYRAKYRGNVR